jgi:hypothetical protein
MDHIATSFVFYGWSAEKVKIFYRFIGEKFAA